MSDQPRAIGSSRRGRAVKGGTRRSKGWRRRVVFVLEGALAYGFYGIFRVLPPAWASALGDRVGRALGRLMPRQCRRCDHHIAWAFPAATPAWCRSVRQGMWGSLGRMVAELAHMDRILAAAVADRSGRARAGDRPRVEIVGADRLRADYVAGKAPVLAIAHTANWEVASTLSPALDVPAYAFYRQFANPWTNALMHRMIAPTGVNRLGTGEGKRAGRRGLQRLREGYALAVIVDQHIEGGLILPFFDRPAATSPAAADFARHLDRRIYPVRVERTGNACFRITLEEPIQVARSESRQDDVAAAMRTVNARVEAWVRDRPAQWLWLHRRWKASLADPDRRRRQRGAS